MNGTVRSAITGDKLRAITVIVPLSSLVVSLLRTKLKTGSLSSIVTSGSVRAQLAADRRAELNRERLGQFVSLIVGHGERDDRAGLTGRNRYARGAESIVLAIAEPLRMSGTVTSLGASDASVMLSGTVLIASPT